MGFINDESFKIRLRLIVSATGFRGPADRRLAFPVCDQQTPKPEPETIRECFQHPPERINHECFA
jgi:hypothetical protein